MPTPTARSEAIAWAEDWVGRPALEGLVRHFGGPPRADRDALSWLEVLAPFSEAWDFRRGRERNLATAPTFATEDTNLILDAATALGMRGAQPVPGHGYDAIVILGGLVRASLARPLFAARALGDGSIRAKRVVALGGHRTLGGDEVDMAERLIGAHANDELDAMDAGVRHAFGVDEPALVRGEESDVVGASWTVREYQTREGVAVDVIAAPSSEPGRRANTADTYRWLATSSGLLAPGAQIVIVTTQLYVPFQAADAWRELRLPHDIFVEAVGIDPGGVDPRLEQLFQPHWYLQETRSAILAMQRLLIDATA